MLLSASSFAVQNRHLLTSLRAASPRDPRNAASQYLACGSQSVARHIRAQTRRSLNECALVRLASQAVQPSQNIVAYRPWSGRYAPCFSPTSPRFIRHRRRFGANAETILHVRPLAKFSKRVGRMITTFPAWGALRISKPWFWRRFLHTFCRCWQKVCRRRHLPTFQASCPHTADNQMCICFLNMPSIL